MTQLAAWHWQTHPHSRCNSNNKSQTAIRQNNRHSSPPAIQIDNGVNTPYPTGVCPINPDTTRYCYKDRSYLYKDRSYCYKDSVQHALAPMNRIKHWRHCWTNPLVKPVFLLHTLAATRGSRSSRCVTPEQMKSYVFQQL
jgi:hypothetical protein